MLKLRNPLIGLWGLTVLVFGFRAEAVSVADYSSIQAAIDAHPGRMVFVPDGDYTVSEKIRIAGEGGGLYGYGRILQSNPETAVLEIEHATGVRIEGITFSRAEGQEDAAAPGILLIDCRDTLLDGIRVRDCRAREAAIELRDCRNCTVRDSVVHNYKRIAIDDRTGPGLNLYGYAFHCIDGTGIMVSRCVGTRIQDNRIVDDRLLPTRENKERYKLGSLTDGKYPSKEGRLASDAFRTGYVNNWHQGSAIIVTGPKETHHSIVTGNYIENAAQGIDLHTDHANCSHNTIYRCMIGIKMTHGCRNLLVDGNLVTHADLWGILLNPGALSHYIEAATGEQPARPANVDAGTIVSNNIVSDYGYGNENWNWGAGYAIALYEGQLEENPPLRDILIAGNLVYDTGRDGFLVDGDPEVFKPRYRYALYVGPWGEPKKSNVPDPRDLHLSGNVFHPGLEGISNIEIVP